MKTLKDLPFLVFSELLSSHVRTAAAWAQGTPFQDVPHCGTWTMAVLFWRSCPPRPACMCLQPCPAHAPGHRRAIWKPGTEELDLGTPNEHRFMGTSNSMSKAQFLILLPRSAAPTDFPLQSTTAFFPLIKPEALDWNMTHLTSSHPAIDWIVPTQKKDMFKSQPSAPQNAISFRKWIVADVISEVWCCRTGGR